jgi:hypothetical protein
MCEWLASCEVTDQTTSKSYAKEDMQPFKQFLVRTLPNRFGESTKKVAEAEFYRPKA